MQYRGDIDGLRALAVLSVIFYHLGFSFITGGFVGVDIFFVISGFLITQTIQKDIYEKTFTIKNFYIKRIRRIIPALFVVTFFTIIFSFILLPNNEIKEFAQSVLSVATFTSNIFFWHNVDYFSVVAELKPLLHTWSLGIEEQFYILFPIFMLLTIKLPIKKTLLLIFLFTVISFSISISPLGVKYITANFFLPITRFWELLTGVALAISMKSISSKNINLNNFISIIGLILILGSFFMLDNNSVFPGVNTFYPVVGSILIIYSAINQNTFIATVLSNKVLRYIGLISFSLYLWHWPIIALTKSIVYGELTFLMQLGIFVLTLILSIISYEFVEKPFRRKEQYKNFLQIKNGLFALFLLVMMAISILIYQNLNFKDDKAPEINTGCFKTKETLESISRCTFGDKNSRKIFILYGDSHSSAMFPVFEKLATENGWKGIRASFSGCPPLFNVFRLDGIGNASNCTGEYSKNVEDFISTHKYKIQKIFLVSRWNLYEEGWIKNGRLQKATHFLSSEDIKSQNAEDSSKVLKKAIIKTITKLSEEYSIETNIIKSVPILKANINKNIPEVTLKEYLKQRAFTDSVFSTFAKNPLVNIIDPIDIFCPTDKCIMYKKNKALYKDDNHVSSYGSFLFYPIIKSHLKAMDDDKKHPQIKPKDYIFSLEKPKKEIKIKDISNQLLEGRAWNAKGTYIFDQNGVSINLNSPIKINKLYLGLDNNDVYKVTLNYNNKVIDSLIVNKKYIKGGGLSTRLLEINNDEKINKINIYPVKGDGYYSIGYMKYE